ncbi:MAG: TlpA family protein disulfide reductase [Bacteroidetes bacterium HGW-Bacteroidetes-7]|jgi:peroxiredoxin|nr:MAG: TlpA family protein disulfide reductase [Bacteroidetes bacterium HGW-Bacteroidetes-7]
MKKVLYFTIIAMMALISCKESSPSLMPGMWRASLLTQDTVEIPFVFEVKISENDTVFDIITGDYRYEVKDIKVIGDSLFINMPLFSSNFKILLTKSGMEGNLIRSSYTMPFKAEPNSSARFKETHEIKGIAAGRWQITLGEKELIGEFEETESRVTGSFLSPSGDYRFFEGVVNKEGKLMMSCFDGGFIRLFVADIDGDTLRNIKMHSGFSSVEDGTGFRNPNAALPDAYSVTGLKKGYTTLGFTFPDMDGNPVSLSDERFKDKITVVQISGSWCPNCLDESRFLMEMLQKYSAHMEVICLTFERSDDFEKAKTEAKKLVDVAGITYPVLITGHTPANVKIALPELDNFRAFPTSLIIDKKGKVRKIHSGFSGPGTGVHYRNFVSEFTSFVDSLIAE